MMADAGLWKRFCTACLLAVAMALPAGGQSANDSSTLRSNWKRPSRPDTARLLYKGYSYGSDAYYSPVTVLLNKGYDIFQLRHSKRDIFTMPYSNAWKYGVAEIFRQPGPIVQRFGGWGRFASVEVYPSSFKAETMNWLVNYTEHFLGGGLTMRMLHEYYVAHNVAFPRIAAMATTYAASVLNEVSEQGAYNVPMAGNVADLLIFDLGAVLLFHWDQPTRFLTQTLQMSDWSNQAAITFPNGQLQNNGQYFVMKVPIGLQRTRLFVRGGLGAQAGVSRKVDDEHSVSIGMGGATSVRDIDATGHETVEFAPGAGVYYDRNNSLLWSVTTSPVANLVSVNVYPGVLKGIGERLGLWAVYTRDNEFRFGIAHSGALGIGAGYGR
jgi:hypothetical protein